MGHKSYAEFALHSTMAASPEVVMSFLLEMSEVVRPKADQVCSGSRFCFIWMRNRLCFSAGTVSNSSKCSYVWIGVWGNSGFQERE